jgi:putative nucleotidyltransferase with HDIG domain
MIEELIPEINEIQDAELREKVKQVWEYAIREGGWEGFDLNKIPFTLLIPTQRDLITHTRMVTKMAMAVGRTRGDVDMDLLTAGAILHDVGKLLEFKHDGEKVIKSEYGTHIRHPVSGAMLAEKFNLPWQIAHIIAAHSKEGEFIKRIPEAVIVNHCDFTDFHIEKSKL